MKTKSAVVMSVTTGKRLSRPAGIRFERLRRTFLGCLAALVLAGVCHTASASDPVGVYAYVTKVVFEPNETAPERIQVWGRFALAEGSGFKYKDAEAGYMYFTVKPGSEKTCRNEWRDLKSVAGTKEIVGFGGRYGQNGTVRPPDAPPKDPDVYPLGFGMIKVPEGRRPDYPPFEDLRAFKESKHQPPPSRKQH